ncbi:MAG: site-specific integrase [Acidobacteriia bacterium]|nr:site-specific integrase [Terriglobia bacterium]
MGVKVREKVKGSGVWWVFVNHDGERSSTQVGSLKAANRTKEDFEHRVALGLELFPERKPAPTVPTFEKYYEKFERTYLSASCRESTVDRYDQDFRLHLKPKLGAVPLNEIAREQIKELIADMMAKGLSRNSIRNTMATLRVTLNQAIEDELIISNPATKLSKFFKQAKAKRKFDFLTAEEVPPLLRAARDRDARRKSDAPEYFPLFLCAIHTGMREGELAGLQWADIDWNGRFILVERSVADGKVSPTKTDKARRVDMSDDLIEELSGYRRRRLEAAMRDGRNELPEWVFSSSRGTALDVRNVSKREFPRCLAKAKLRRIRFHDLRHTFASLLIQNGESLAYVKEQLGHSSIKITVDVYGHLVPGANRQAVCKLPSLNGSKAKEETTRTEPESAPQAHPAKLAAVSDTPDRT